MRSAEVKGISECKHTYLHLHLVVNGLMKHANRILTTLNVKFKSQTICLSALMKWPVQF